MLQEEQQVRLKELEQERKVAMKAQSITDELLSSRSQRYQAMFASLGMELEHQIAEQLRFVEEATILEEEVKAGSKKLVQLDDRIGEIQKQIDALLGEEGHGELGDGCAANVEGGRLLRERGWPLRAFTRSVRVVS